MGMYTGLRFKGIIKKEYREVINDLMFDECVNTWESLINKYPQLNFMSELASLPRSSMIPFGSLAYMPEEWEELIDPSLGSKWDNYKDANGWERSYDAQSGYWQFQCSLKNYDGEIECFLKTVAPIITEKVVHIEKHYEEDRYGHLYKLIDGKLIENEDKKVDYEPWRTDEEDSMFWYR